LQKKIMKTVFLNDRSSQVYTSVTSQIAPGTPTPTPGKIKTSQSSKQETSTFLTPKMQERPMKKRKAAASPSPNEDRAGNSNQRVMDRLVAQVGKLSKIVGDAYHPKKDLKAVAESLVSLVAQLRVCNTPQESEEEASKEAERQKGKSDKAEGKPKEEVEKKETTTQTPADWIKNNVKDLEKRNMASQTESRSKDGNLLDSLQGVDTLETWKKEEKKKWTEEVFTNTGVVVGNPLVDAKDSVVKVVLVEPTDIEMEASIQWLYRNRFPELAEVKEDWAVLTQTTQLEGTEPTRKKVFRIHHVGTDEDLWPKFQRLREETKEDERLAIYHVQSMSVLRLKKMVEAIFHGAKTQVMIYSTKQRAEQENEGGIKARSKTTVPEGRKEQRKGQRKTYALIVDDKKDNTRKFWERLKRLLPKITLGKQ
jgi:hypothetical protein